ncbi:MAG: tetrathionate reductase subunit TtrB [Neisseriaceae bacterium]|nr:tetrathionate reductase subunit TtrB [Neisseriaceae bacterium]MBP6862505.1 tetrathionate reductase subunit TtrB [Neisseriaceae bacterium]
MDVLRRGFLKNMATLTAGAALVPLAEAGMGDQPARREGDASKRYGMLVDLRRCIGCQACTVSCSVENQMPPGQFRTTVRQYQVVEAKTGRATNVVLPRLCNHCDNPPCIPVCPVQATFQRQDGIVVVDNKRCVGCAYCVQACPYEARFINHDTGTADKCNFCAHRLEAGLLPGCVESCVGGARIIGDLKDPHSTISKMLTAHQSQIKVLKPEQGTVPQVFYLGLDDAFVSNVKGQAMLWEEVHV